MSRKKMKYFWIVVFASNLIPIAALGEASPVQKKLPTDLTMEDIGEGAIKNFEVVRNGNKFTLTGVVFKDCLNENSLKISNTAIDKSIRTVNKQGEAFIGFELKDSGGAFRACMKAHKDREEDCDENSCKDLSSLPGAIMAVTDQLHPESAGVVTIGLMHKDFNKPDSEKNQFQAFDQQFKHSTREKQRQDRIARLSHKLDSCRKSSKKDDLDEARAALNGLLAEGAIDFRNFDEITKKIDQSLINADLKELADRAKTEKAEDLESLRGEVLAWNEDPDHAGHSDEAAGILRTIAVRYSQKAPGGVAGYNLAQETMKEASQIEGLSASSQFSIANDMRAIEIGKLQTLATYGMANNYMFMPQYYNFMQQLQTDMMSSCGMMNPGYNYSASVSAGGFNFNNGSPAAAPSQEACASAISTMQMVQQIPQQAQQVDWKRAQMQAELQRQMAQYQGQVQNPYGGFQIPGQLGNTGPFPGAPMFPNSLNNTGFIR